MVIALTNSNFHHVAGENIFDRSNDIKYIEYRKKWKEWPEKQFAGGFPLFIDIEVTSVCNLKCPFCATTYRGDLIKKGFIKEEVIKSIINEGSQNGLYGVKFNYRGEPLLHKKIHEFVRYAKDKGLIDVYYNTNVVLLTEEKANEMIDSGLDRVSISIEGYTKDLYEKCRVGAKFDQVLKNVKMLQDIKNRRGSLFPKVRVQTVMLPEIEKDFDNYKKFWSAIADEVAYLDFKEMKDRKKGIEFPWACPQLWQRMSILWDGTILPCNHDDDALLALGKVGEVTIKDAWKSAKLENIRKLHSSGNSHKISSCDGCYLRDSEIAKLKEKK